MRISVMITESRKESVEREDSISSGPIQPEAETVATSLQLTRFPIVPLVAIVAAAALLLALITGHRLMPALPFPYGQAKNLPRDPNR